MATAGTRCRNIALTLALVLVTNAAQAADRAAPVMRSISESGEEVLTEGAPVLLPRPAPDADPAVTRLLPPQLPVAIGQPVAEATLSPAYAAPFMPRRRAASGPLPYGAVGTKVSWTCRPRYGARLNATAYASEIESAGELFGVEPALIRAIIHAESTFNPRARSPKGARGLMQLIPATAARFGVVDAFDPVQNIRGGVQYIAWLQDRYGGDLALVAAGYNAGEGAVDRYGGIPPYPETTNYVTKVLSLRDRYRTGDAGHVARAGQPRAYGTAVSC